MPNPIRDYLHLLGVGSSTADPSIPFENEFYLLGLDESDSDLQIALKAKEAAATRSHDVDRKGQANQNKRLDVLVRDKINQAGARFDGQPENVKSHRDELNRLRDRRLKDFSKDLCDSGKWTAEQGADMLETMASRIGITPDRVQKAVADATQICQWSSSPSGGTPPPKYSSSDSVTFGGKEVPLWWLILPIGLALGLIDGWAGLAFGIAFLFLAWGKANAEKRRNPAAPSRQMMNFQWGLVNAGVASLPLLVLLIWPPGAGDSAKWAGEWDTDWGKMTFNAESKKVTSHYQSRTGPGKVDLKSSNERQLDGSWCLRSCTAPNDTGRLRLVLDANGQSFKGWFTYGLDSEITVADDAENQIVGKRKAPK